MRALFVTVRMKPEYRDQILKGALEDGRGSREDEPGCLRFDVFQDDSDPNTIYFYEVYWDDAALEAHRAAPHYPAWGNLPADWFVGHKAVAIRGTMIAPSEAEYRWNINGEFCRSHCENFSQRRQRWFRAECSHAGPKTSGRNARRYSPRAFVDPAAAV